MYTVCGWPVRPEIWVACETRNLALCLKFLLVQYTDYANSRYSTWLGHDYSRCQNAIKAQNQDYDQPTCHDIDFAIFK